MIRVRKRITALNNEGTYLNMFNLEIVKKTRIVQYRKKLHFFDWRLSQVQVLSDH